MTQCAEASFLRVPDNRVVTNQIQFVTDVLYMLQKITESNIGVARQFGKKKAIMNNGVLEI